MKASITVALTGFSLLGFTTPAFAQAAPTASVASDEIIVTARRRDESLQDVPVTVNAVTSEAIERLNIRRFDEITTVVPGLSLAANGNGIGSVSTVRGVNFDVNASGSNGTIEYYFNDAPISSGLIFQSLFDVGQIEVLRGPQGTLRGRASPSGSITITSRRPDLTEVGGSASITVNDIKGYNVNGAINVPIFGDRLAIRVAGVNEYNRGNLVTSQVNPRDIKNETRGIRVGVRGVVIEDILTYDFIYQGLNRSAVQYDQLESVSESVAGGAASPVTLTARQRQTRVAAPRELEQRFTIYNWQVQLALAGQRLTYVGALSTQFVDTTEPRDFAAVFTNLVAPNGNAFAQRTLNDSRFKSHEIRLQNDERIGGLLDYVVGYLDFKVSSPTSFNNNTGIALLAPTPFLANVAFTPIGRYNDTKERSVYGNITLHLGDSTEISGGLRKIWYDFASGVLVNGVEALANRRLGSEGATVYSASVKHKFTPDLMVYGTYGTSWRPSISIIGGPTANISALQNSFLNLPSENSRSFEAGIKSSWLDNRLRVNLSVYHQKFTNYPNRAPGIGVYAIDASSGAPVVTPFNYVAPVPVTVTGFEAEVVARPLDGWTLSGVLSYANGKIKGGIIPCTDLDGNGIPDVITAAPTLAALQARVGANNISTCAVTQNSNVAAPWSGTIQSEYAFNVGGGSSQGYVRGLYAFKGNSIGDPNNAFDSVGSYGILNAYLGIRDAGGGWDIGLYAKNLTDTFKVLSRTNGPQTTALRGGIPLGGGAVSAGSTSATNYFGITTTEPREFGINLRFAFGSK